uniref:Uncharacterized protein n=1 Tax=Branchiostoma floridae TaxID=7739 RepID=C3YFJ4_BRAFL|eukprot:XP_002604947.1 hypothetical protein BRAFLDRAFT_92587 [Branchiostoma floridae]
MYGIQGFFNAYKQVEARSPYTSATVRSTPIQRKNTSHVATGFSIDSLLMQRKKKEAKGQRDGKISPASRPEGSSSSSSDNSVLACWVSSRRRKKRRARERKKKEEKGQRGGKISPASRPEGSSESEDNSVLQLGRKDKRKKKEEKGQRGGKISPASRPEGSSEEDNSVLGIKLRWSSPSFSQ